jgi:hypothetical protein
MFRTTERNPSAADQQVAGHLFAVLEEGRHGISILLDGFQAVTEMMRALRDRRAHDLMQSIPGGDDLFIR